MEVTVAQEIAQVQIERPHVVLLGAGASRAALPGGDRNGKILPLMADFSDVLPIGQILDPLGIEHESKNFENVYSSVSKDKHLDDARIELENLIYEYFDSLRLPEEPTLYDYLVRSLRPKDVIATFNWDPFLIEAACRNYDANALPYPILFRDP